MMRQVLRGLDRAAQNGWCEFSLRRDWSQVFSVSLATT